MGKAYPTAQETYTRVRQLVRISAFVKRQILSVSVLSISAILAFLFGNYSNFSEGVRSFLLGLSGNLLVAIIIFLFLERQIRSVHPITDYPNLPAADFINDISRAKASTQIRILETFTGLINDNFQEFTTALRHSLRNGAKIEILLIHPFSDGAKQRAKQLKGQVEVQDELRKNLARFYEFQVNLSGADQSNFSVKIYKTSPTVSIYHCGDWAYISIFPLKERADRNPNLQVPMYTRVGETFERHFDEMWTGTLDTPTIPLASHMRLHIGTSLSGPGSSHPGHYFAYAETNNQIDKSTCFMWEENHSFFLLYDTSKEKDKVIFQIDTAYWQAVPHRMQLNDPHELQEHKRACQLIEKRYGWDAGRLGSDANIIRFQGIEEVSKEQLKQQKASI